MIFETYAWEDLRPFFHPTSGFMAMFWGAELAKLLKNWDTILFHFGMEAWQGQEVPFPLDMASIQGMAEDMQCGKGVQNAEVDSRALYKSFSTPGRYQKEGEVHVIKYMGAKLGKGGGGWK